LARNDYGNFVRYGLRQLTHGPTGDDLATDIERVPIETGRAVWEMNLYVRRFPEYGCILIYALMCGYRMEKT
jgi:hypothetical protein